jgi:hypothetical protein
MATDRIRHTQSVREAEQLRDEYVTQGYKVESAGENTTIVKKSTWGTTAGHIGVALLTIWWTFGIGNLIYAVVVHKSDEVLIKVDSE